MARFDRDVPATPGLGAVVLSVFPKVFPGAPVTTDDVIAGYRAPAGCVGLALFG